MLTVLMYHRVTEAKAQANPQALEDHLSFLSKNYPIVLPGDKLHSRRMNICLTFDDAYFDFYERAFPLLEKLQIPAVLAIPSGLVLDKTDISAQTRLEVPYLEALRAHQTHATLCTWEEINKMIATGLVMPACHGLTHQKIDTLNFHREVIEAKQLLETKTQKNIEVFVYPYGRMKGSVNKLVKQHFPYTMRIGSSLNFNWNNANKVIYRIDADKHWLDHKPLFSPQNISSLGLRFLSNTLRLR